MTLLLDAGPLVALADPAEPQRDAILDILTTETGALVIPAPTTAEVDYLLGRRFGPAARRAFLSDLATGDSRSRASSAPTTPPSSTSMPATPISSLASPTARS